MTIRPAFSAKRLSHLWFVLAVLWISLPAPVVSQTPIAKLANETFTDNPGATTNLADTTARREWMARLTAFLADPVFGQQSNSGIDIVSFGGSVWIGSTRGVSFTPDSGKTWFTHNDSTGLLASNISALTIINDTLWLATARTEVFDSDPVTSGRGIQYTADSLGDFWDSPQDTSGLLDISTVGPLKNTFDIAGVDSLLFTANFVGGLIGTKDMGKSWKRFNVTPADGAYFADPVGPPPLTSRYFSTVVDSAHIDTTIVWAGHAGGVSRFDFIGERLKPSSTRIFDFAYAPAIPPDDSGFIFIGGDRGLSRATALGYSRWKSVFARDGIGLPSDVINQLHFFAGWVFVGCLDSVDGDGVGFVRALTSLSAFPTLSDGVIDSVYSKPGARVMDFADFASRYLYVAGASAGLFVSADTGLTWTHIVTDAFPGFTTSDWATVNAVRADSAGDLWCGTDAGMLKLSIDRIDQSGAVVTSAFHLPMVDEPQIDLLGQTGSGASVRRIEIQKFVRRNAPSIVDSTIIWAASFPVSDSGEFSTYRILPYTIPPSIDAIFFRTARIDQIMHRGLNAYFVGLDGMFEVQTSDTSRVKPIPFVSVRDTSRTPQFSILLSAGVRAILAVGDTTHLGTEQFFGVSTAPKINNLNWHLTTANTVEFTADSLALYNTANSDFSGNFVPALSVQHRQGVAPIIWAATRRGDASDITGGVNVSYLDMTTTPDTISNWVPLPDSSVLKDVRVWNFAFNGDTIYAASDSGLFSSPAPGAPFSLVDLVSTDVDEQIRLGATVNGVAVIGDVLWVATDDGFARRGLADVFFDVFKVKDNTTQKSYAFPVPFNPTRDNVVRFHYSVPAGASSASIFVYDFAMNLVRRVSTNVRRIPGIMAHGVPSDDWDGTNGLGEMVAPGIYYFKVEFSNGDNSWGKVAVIP